MRHEDTILIGLREAIGKLPPEIREGVERAAVEFRRVWDAHGPAAHLANALVVAEHRKGSPP
jgi:hypothetical protein